jgi:segregation and condensation protein B
MNEQGSQLRLLEALLFAATEPLSEEELVLRLGEGAEVPALLRTLDETYAGRGINLVRVAGGWTFRTAPDLAPRLASERIVSRKLSRAAVETLAIVAYHQPATRAEIEAIRGVALARGTLDRLMEAGWVRPHGRRDAPGRPLNWITTPAFLVHFGLADLTELPGLEELKSAGLLDIGPVIIQENTGSDEATETATEADED